MEMDWPSTFRADYGSTTPSLCVKRFRSEQADMVDVGRAHDAGGAGDLSKCEIVFAFYEDRFFGPFF